MNCPIFVPERGEGLEWFCACEGRGSICSLEGRKGLDRSGACLQLCISHHPRSHQSCGRSILSSLVMSRSAEAALDNLSATPVPQDESRTEDAANDADNAADDEEWDNRPPCKRSSGRFYHLGLHHMIHLSTGSRLQRDRRRCDMRLQAVRFLANSVHLRRLERPRRLFVPKEV